MNISAIILASVVSFIVCSTVTHLIITRKAKKDMMFECRKFKFPGEVNRIISEVIFGRECLTDSLLGDATLMRDGFILEAFGMESILKLGSKEILEKLKSSSIPQNILQQLTADFQLMDELGKKSEERRAERDKVFEKVFPKLKFDEWDNMKDWSKRDLVRTIIEGMKNRGEI